MSNRGSSRWESTRELLKRYKAGDDGALERIYERYAPRLLQWARHRLPHGIDPANSTADLVQDALLATIPRLREFDLRHEGALHAYLHQAVLNEVRTTIARAKRGPDRPSSLPEQADPAPSPLEQTIGREAIEMYERGLAALPLDVQAAIRLRMEHGMPHDRIAEILGKPNGNAARMTVKRALLKLAKEMGREK